ncbi:unnamed protein product [Soboliphyme baturini]|uniref:Growth/differentiation factor 8 n=1 Tax=Soboliphyme baturini TaxID=241478 RepID=A0A183IBA0_9BILA|nr:unnamed protein product [Soboliphyme baturini]
MILCAPSSLNLETKEMDIAYFSFSVDTMNNYIHKAYLHFYVQPTLKKLGKSGVKPMLQRIHLYRIDNRHGKETLLDKKEYKAAMHTEGYWDKFNVTRLVQDWFLKPERNFGVVVRVMEKEISTVVHPNIGKNHDKHSMYLNIAVEDKRNNRRKREAAPKTDCQEGESYFKCCRHMQRYLHTHLLQQARPYGNAGPCCYPTNMSPILMVYFNDNKEVLVSKIPGMVVSRCGCA